MSYAKESYTQGEESSSSNEERRPRVELFVAESDHGIYFCCAARGNVAGQQCGSDEEQNHSAESQGIGPKANGSKHLLAITEEIPPGAVIPRHRHHGEDEILLIQTGRAHVWLGDKQYDAQPGAMVFIPAETWISLKNTGKDNISIIAIWNEPGFEQMALCGSVPKGQVGEVLSRDGVKDCYHHGDAELETTQPPADKKQ